jgi:mono/diheme cytochrome c family protein
MRKKLLLGLLALVLIVAAGGFVFFKLQVRAFDQSITRRYEIPLPTVELSQDPLVLARGKHLSESLGACTTCHGDNFGGGRAEPTGPWGGWTYDDFVTVVRTGKRKNGQPLNPFMPIGALRNYDETELKGLWAYLQTLPPVPFGER